MMPGRPSKRRALELHTCDSCNAETSGYSAAELKQEHGWVWHTAVEHYQASMRRHFVMCGECEAKYAASRQFAEEMGIDPAEELELRLEALKER